MKEDVYFQKNLRYLRKKVGYTQEELALKLGTRRSLIGSYEEGRGVPRLEMIRRMAELFGVTLDAFLAADLSSGLERTGNADPGVKVLTVTVTPENDERITLVPVKASAGYLNGRSDPEYMGQLPHFSMPVPELSQGSSYRVFQVKGDSMLPITPGSYVFCDYVEDFGNIRDGNTYILITLDEGIVYKRIYIQSDDKFLLKSDNPEYSSYTVDPKAVLEIWRALGYLSFDLPDPGAINDQKLSTAISALEMEIRRIKGMIID